MVIIHKAGKPVLYLQGWQPWSYNQSWQPWSLFAKLAFFKLATLLLQTWYTPIVKCNFRQVLPSLEQHFEAHTGW